MAGCRSWRSARYLIILANPRPLHGQVYSGERVFLTPIFGGVERLLLRCFFVDPKREQDWKSYAKSPDHLLARGLDHPLRGPAHGEHSAVEQLRRGGVPRATMGRDLQHGLVVPDHTNWQYYGGETTLTTSARCSG